MGMIGRDTVFEVVFDLIMYTGSGLLVAWYVYQMKEPDKKSDEK